MPSAETSRRASFDSSEPSNSLKTIAPVFNPLDSKPFQPSAYFKPAQVNNSLSSGLSTLDCIKNDFTPSTPYVHKFRTEMCKNWDLYGKCKYGDEVSTKIL
jgi:hypothetical protein